MKMWCGQVQYREEAVDISYLQTESCENFMILTLLHEQYDISMFCLFRFHSMVFPPHLEQLILSLIYSNTQTSLITYKVL